jgi:hypothetical protein
MKNIAYEKIVSIKLERPQHAGTKKTAREIADLLNFGVVKGFVKKPGQELKTHYFNCQLVNGKPVDFYFITHPDTSAEYFVEETA